MMSPKSVRCRLVRVLELAIVSLFVVTILAIIEPRTFSQLRCFLVSSTLRS
ncbi:MAG: hypothetical protein NZ805_06800 [Armatimonadetes bacterium]|nr:hypothetical protein [Armatimonadota bacterium]MDW8028422.1 hypothetical protein [Armatimonadota bacterium]